MTNTSFRTKYFMDQTIDILEGTFRKKDEKEDEFSESELEAQKEELMDKIN